MNHRILSETIPVAPLKLIASPGMMELGQKVDHDLVHYRADKNSRYMANAYDVYGYKSDTFLTKAEINRFSSGEAKATIKETLRGKDVFILSDIMNYETGYTMYGIKQLSSPDDNFQNLKRLIAAASIGHPYRISVILPFLYEGRGNMREKLESLDCAAALQELASMGVQNFITFDAHDPRVQNAIPCSGFDNFYTSLQFIRELLKAEIDLFIDKEHFMVVSPDEGGMNRSIYYANMLGVNMGAFYKRMDYSVPSADGTHPFLSLEFLGPSVKGKSIFLIDDMIDTGKTILSAARELKKQGAKHIYLAATFGLFTDGLDKFDQAFQDGWFDRLYTTNLIYLPESLTNCPYYVNVDLSKYIALIIDTLNHDTSINDIIDPSSEIKKLLEECRR